MRAALIAVLVVVVIGVVSVSSVAGAYNHLVQLRQQVDAAQADVETQLQRRFDLIPNLVESTRAVLAQERTIFEALARARTQYAGTQPGTPQRIDAANNLEGALARLLVIVENYPVLRSSETVQSLMQQLASTENQLAFSRRQYNTAVQVYDTALQTFPTTLVASAFAFQPRPYFQAQPGAQQAPRVNLGVPTP